MYKVPVRAGEVVPKNLAQSIVLDREGRETVLESFWAERPALLLYLRHFGCLCLSAQITELAPRLDELERLGIRTVFISNGDPHFIDTFIERFLLADKPVDIVTDPSLASFRAAGMLRSWWAIFGPRGLWDGIRATADGHVNRFGEGDNLQQGGVVLVDPEGQVAWYYRNISMGGHPPSVEIIDAVMRPVLKRTPLLI